MTWKNQAALASALCLIFSHAINFSTPWPLLPIMARSKGVSQTMVGVIFSSYSFTNLIGSLVIIKFATAGMSKTWFCGGALVSVVSYTGFGYLSNLPDGWPFIVGCLVSRCFSGLGTSCIWGFGFDIAISCYPTIPGKISSLAEAVFAVGLMTGPPIGSMLYAVYGYYLPFAVGGVFQLMVLIASVVFIPARSNTLNPLNDQEDSVFVDIRESKFEWYKHIQLWVLSFSLFLVISAQSFLGVSFAVYLEKVYHVTQNTCGYYFLLPAAIGAIAAPIIGSLVDKGYSSPLYICCLFTMTLGYIILCLPIISPQFVTKPILLVAIVFTGGSVPAGFAACYMCLEKAVLACGYKDDGLIKLMLAVWANLCFQTGSVFGQIIVGGVAFEYLGFYGSCALEGALLILTVPGLMMCLQSLRILGRDSPKKLVYKPIK